MSNQLVVARGSSGRDVLKLASADTALRGTASDRWTPIFGTYDLLRIATFAAQHHHFVDAVQAVGVDGAPLATEDSDALNEELLPQLSNAKAAATLLRTRYPGYTIVSIVLTTPSMHHLRVKRMGEVVTDNPAEAEATLQEAWKMLQLS